MHTPPAGATAPLPTLRRPVIEVDREGVPVGHSPQYEITRSILVYVRLRGPPRLPTHMPMLASLPHATCPYHEIAQRVRAFLPGFDVRCTFRLSARTRCLE